MEGKQDDYESWGIDESQPQKSGQVLTLPVSSAAPAEEKSKQRPRKWDFETQEGDLCHVFLFDVAGKQHGECNMDEAGYVFGFKPKARGIADGTFGRSAKLSIVGKPGGTWDAWRYKDGEGKWKNLRTLSCDESKRPKAGSRRGNKLERLQGRIDKAQRKLDDLKAQLADAQEEALQAVALKPKPVEHVAEEVATAADKASPVPAPSGEHLMAATPQVQGMKKAELKAMAKKLGLKGYSKLKSDALQDRVIDALATSMAG